MLNKRVLMFYCPGLAGNHVAMGPAILGYEVIQEEILNCDELQDDNALSNIMSKYEIILNEQQLMRFDAIIVAIIFIPLSSFIIPKTFVNDLKNKASEFKSPENPLPCIIGINPFMEGKELQIQTKIFDGLFIGEEGFERMVDGEDILTPMIENYSPD